MEPKHFNKPPVQVPEVIMLIEDRGVLVRKLEEYKQRQASMSYQAPEQHASLIYKITLLEELLPKGEVRTSEVKEKLKQRYGQIDEREFTSACLVIDDYIKTGGKRVSGGTGLPRMEEPPEE